MINTLLYEIIYTISHGKRETSKASSSEPGFNQRVLESVHHRIRHKYFFEGSACLNARIFSRK